MSYTQIQNVELLDLTPYHLESGDDDEVPPKMNGLMAALQANVAAFHAAIESINARGAEIESTQTDDAQAISDLSTQVSSRLGQVATSAQAIDALALAINNLSTGGVGGLDQALSALSQADDQERSERTLEGQTLSGAITDLQEQITATLLQISEIGIDEVDGLRDALTAITQSAAQASSAQTIALAAIVRDAAALRVDLDNALSAGGVSVSELAVTAASIAQLVASAGGLTTGSIAGLNEKLEAIQSNPLRQLLPNGGTLISGDLVKSTDPGLALSGAAPSHLSLLLRESNIQVLEYTQVNYAAAQDPLAESLLVAFGKDPSSLYLYYAEFYIAKIRVINDIYGSYLGTPIFRGLLAGSSATTGIDKSATMGYWIKSDTQDGVAINNNHYLDGVLRGTGELPDTEWHHISKTLSSSSGYANSINGLYGSVGTEFYMALPILTQGNMQIPVHTQPVW